jgi:hypothetical protein
MGEDAGFDHRLSSPIARRWERGSGTTALQSHAGAQYGGSAAPGLPADDEVNVSAAKRTIRYAVVGLGHIVQVAVLPAFAHATRNSQLVAVVRGDRRLS